MATFMTNSSGAVGNPISVTGLPGPTMPGKNGAHPRLRKARDLSPLPPHWSGPSLTTLLVGASSVQPREPIPP